MAFFRALESVRPEGRRLFVDPLAERFVGAGLRRAVRASRWGVLASIVNWYADWRLPGARTSAIARTKLIDEVLVDALRPRATDSGRSTLETENNMVQTTGSTAGSLAAGGCRASCDFGGGVRLQGLSAGGVEEREGV